MAGQSKTTLQRKMNTLVRYIYRKFDGGTQFGVDLPTLRVVYPHLHERYMELKQQLLSVQ